MFKGRKASDESVALGGAKVAAALEETTEVAEEAEEAIAEALEEAVAEEVVAEAPAVTDGDGYFTYTPTAK